MNPLLAADLADLKAAHRKLEGRIGTYRLSDAQRALAAESATVPQAKATPATSQTTASSSVAGAEQGLPGSLSASEKDALAFLQRSGVKFYGLAGQSNASTSQQQQQQQQPDSEAETLAFLRQTGAISPVDQPIGAPSEQRRWNR